MAFDSVHRDFGIGGRAVLGVVPQLFRLDRRRTRPRVKRRRARRNCDRRRGHRTFGRRRTAVRGQILRLYDAVCADFGCRDSFAENAVPAFAEARNARGTQTYRPFRLYRVHRRRLVLPSGVDLAFNRVHAVGRKLSKLRLHPCFGGVFPRAGINGVRQID